MKQKQENSFAAVLTSKAGSCLTLANWQEIGVDTASYYLAALLMKPGLSFLNTLTNLRDYWSWQGTIVLNATLPPANREGVYTLRSHYDGSLVHIDRAELFSLFVKLQPDIVILPPGLANYHSLPWQSLPKAVKFFIPDQENLQAPADVVLGNYLSYDKTKQFSDFAQQIASFANEPIYVAGELSLLQARALVEQGIALLESDKPAMDAIIGQIYSEQGLLALLDSEMAHQHEVIEANCSCPTCSQGFTRAYLHHLLIQTPLLCQRFLIQHNVHYYRNRIQVST